VYLSLDLINEIRLIMERMSRNATVNFSKFFIAEIIRMNRLEKYILVKNQEVSLNYNPKMLKHLECLN